MQKYSYNNFKPFSIIKRFPQVYMKKDQVYVDDWKQTVIDWAHDWFCDGWDENKKHLYLYGRGSNRPEFYSNYHFLIRELFGIILNLFNKKNFI
jgi:hypothetical protein